MRSDCRPLRWVCKKWPVALSRTILCKTYPHFIISLYSSVVERQSCKLKVLGSIPSGGSLSAKLVDVSLVAISFSPLAFELYDKQNSHTSSNCVIRFNSQITMDWLSKVVAFGVFLGTSIQTVQAHICCANIGCVLHKHIIDVFLC